MFCLTKSYQCLGQLITDVVIARQGDHMPKKSVDPKHNRVPKSWFFVWMTQTAWICKYHLEHDAKSLCKSESRSVFFIASANYSRMLRNLSSNTSSCLSRSISLFDDETNWYVLQIYLPISIFPLIVLVVMAQTVCIKKYHLVVDESLSTITKSESRYIL